MYKVTIQDIEKGEVLIDEEVRGMVMTSLPANQFGDERAFCNAFIVDKLSTFDILALLDSTMKNLGKSIESLDKPTQLLLALYLKAMREKGDTDNGTDEII